MKNPLNHNIKPKNKQLNKIKDNERFVRIKCYPDKMRISTQNELKTLQARRSTPITAKERVQVTASPPEPSGVPAHGGKMFH